jgi:hypothetical protein
MTPSSRAVTHVSSVNRGTTVSSQGPWAYYCCNAADGSRDDAMPGSTLLQSLVIITVCGQRLRKPHLIKLSHQRSAVSPVSSKGHESIKGPFLIHSPITHSQASCWARHLPVMQAFTSLPGCVLFLRVTLVQRRYNAEYFNCQGCLSARREIPPR